MTNPASSHLAPPMLHSATVGPAGDTCDTCRAAIPPHGPCLLSVRHAYEQSGTRLVAVEPVVVLMCPTCGRDRRHLTTPALEDR